MERCPGHLGAHLGRLQQLCRKWGGSHELMHEFATGAASGPHADMLCVLVPQAYYEHLFDVPKDSPERKFIQSAESRAELKDLAERTIFRPGYRPNPRSPYAAANMFGWAFAYAGLWPEAKAAYAPILTIDKIMQNEHYKARNTIVPVENPRIGPVRMTGVVPKIPGIAEKPIAPAPALGEHNVEVYGELLGLTESDLAALRKKGTI